jgi:phosphoglycolate phosphatase-like HAD superfamily hydrolase
MTYLCQKSELLPVIELVIFDADLTLIDSFIGVHEIYCRVAEKLKLVKPSQTDLKRQWGKKVEDIVVELFGRIEAEKVIETIPEIAGGYRHKLFPGVGGSLLKISAAGLKLGILSTASKNLVIPHLEAAGEASLFEMIIGGEDTSQRKPHPSVFDAFLRSWKKQKMVYVGDALVDWEAARDAGLGLFLAVTTGHTSKKDFVSAGVPKNQILRSAAAVPKALGL